MITNLMPAQDSNAVHERARRRDDEPPFELEDDDRREEPVSDRDQRAKTKAAKLRDDDEDEEPTGGPRGKAEVVNAFALVSPAAMKFAKANPGDLSVAEVKEDLNAVLASRARTQLASAASGAMKAAAPQRGRGLEDPLTSHTESETPKSDGLTVESKGEGAWLPGWRGEAGAVTEMTAAPTIQRSPLAAAPVNELYRAALDDPSLRVQMASNAARLVLSLGDEGTVAMQVRVKDRVADVTVLGPAKEVLTAEAPKLAAALSEQGLSLGNFNLGQQDQREQSGAKDESDSNVSYEAALQNLGKGGGEAKAEEGSAPSQKRSGLHVKA